MDILESIGLNGTILLQFAIFFVTYIFVNGLVFKPYNKAYEERTRRTEGNKGLANEILSQTQLLQQEYEQKAKILNQEFKVVYDTTRTEANREYDRLVNSAKEQANKIFQENRRKIEEQYALANAELSKEAPMVSATIATKLLGKEIGI